MKKQLIKILLKYEKQEKWLFLIFWLFFIYALSSQPNLFASEFVNIWHLIIRKIGHMFVFGFLLWLFYRVLNLSESQKVNKNLLWALIFTIIYASLDEYHQSFVPGRQGVWWDVGIDTIGGLVCIWLIWIMSGEFFKSKIKNQNDKSKCKIIFN